MILWLLAATISFAQSSPAAEPEGELEHDQEAEPDITWRQSGYLDVGWFYARGVAYERDAQHRVLGDEYAHAPWVFYGDPWSNTINSQGDSADLGLGDTNIDRYDPIASRGRPSFIVNRYHHAMVLEGPERLGLRVGVNLEPRVGRLGRLGDVMGVDTAHLTWRPLYRHDLKVYVGKVEPGFGREYRYRHAPARFGVTPSLMARYLYGPQTGVRIRGSLRRWFSYSLAVTNGSAVAERFGHFSDELDSNGVPTATARVGFLVRQPVRLEGGLSGQIGAQDGQSDPGVVGWQAGFDARLDWGMLGVEVEGVWTHQPGGVAARQSLQARGGLLVVEVRPMSGFGAFVRADIRDAELLTWPNLYVTDTLRLTGGVRVEANPKLAFKAEYVRIEEIRRGADDDLDDDVLTASVVMAFSSRRRPL